MRKERAEDWDDSLALLSIRLLPSFTTDTNPACLHLPPSHFFSELLAPHVLYRVSQKGLMIEFFEVRQLWALSGHFWHFWMLWTLCDIYGHYGHF